MSATGPDQLVEQIRATMNVVLADGGVPNAVEISEGDFERFSTIHGAPVQTIFGMLVVVNPNRSDGTAYIVDGNRVRAAMRRLP